MGGIQGKGLYRRLGVAVAALAALAIVGSASAAQSSSVLARSSTFDSTNEGWVVLSDTGVGLANWQSTGGNPGGFVSAQFSPPDFGAFESTRSTAGGTWDPGNALANYGGTLTADLMASDATSDALVGFFSDNSGVLPCVDVGAVGSAWATYTATLDTGHLVDCVTNNPLTGAQASAALAGFDSMFVLVGDTDNSVDNVSLDNAALAGPQTPVTPPTGAVSRKFTLTYSAHKFQGTLAAVNDYSCAGKTKVTIFRKGKKPVKVGTVTTSAPNLQLQSGAAKFSLKLKKVVKGSYYASVKKAKSGLDGNTCSAANSKTVKAH